MTTNFENDNLFVIRKSPESVIAAQALTLDDYVYRIIDDKDRVGSCVTKN